MINVWNYKSVIRSVSIHTQFTFLSLSRAVYPPSNTNRPHKPHRTRSLTSAPKLVHVFKRVNKYLVEKIHYKENILFKFEIL